ncbi:hypothetical protein F0562_010895 [Nyssa sinensis]|uniref:Formiminotransferase N-terminal subdomain domain-containing protein n=1 Tax=Nyssa sinensis TaxID=561372 RepID=A0A5J5A3T7_9ASTE|nr:hypothetical protein F0562_010895 [Nyssa sinensis]
MDIFDSSLNLEETHFNDGFNEGYNDGLSSGKDEGRQVGLKHGFEIGEELGFYRGCIDVWKSATRVDPTCFSSRVQKTITQMDEWVRKYPILDPENESVTETMKSLRLKFRAVCATLNLKLEYNGYPKTSDAQEKAALINKFEDETYNRVGYTLVSKLAPKPSSDSRPLSSAVFAMVKAALEAIDLELHCGSHPQLGVVDHICFHPLSHTSLDQMAGIA